MSNSHRVQTVGQGLTMADQNETYTDTLTVQVQKVIMSTGPLLKTDARIKKGNKATYIISHTKTVALERWTTT